MCLATVGLIGVSTGRGMNPETGLGCRIAITLFIAIFPLFIIILNGMTGKIDVDRTSILEMIWLFAITPLISAFAFLGLFASWNIICEYGYKVVLFSSRSGDAKLNQNDSEPKTQGKPNAEMNSEKHGEP